MRQRLLTAILCTGLLFGNIAPAFAITRSQARYLRHKRHVRTAKRVGIGAAGGAAIGALAGGGKGAAIGALVGGGAGALYDRNKRHHHRRYRVRRY